MCQCTSMFTHWTPPRVYVIVSIAVSMQVFLFSRRVLLHSNNYAVDQSFFSVSTHVLMFTHGIQPRVYRSRVSMRNDSAIYYPPVWSALFSHVLHYYRVML